MNGFYSYDDDDVDEDFEQEDAHENEHYNPHRHPSSRAMVGQQTKQQPWSSPYYEHTPPTKKQPNRPEAAAVVSMANPYQYSYTTGEHSSNRTESARPSLLGSNELEQLQLEGLLEMESRYQVPHVACTSSGTSLQHHEEWRHKICTWSFRVIDHFGLDREVVSAAMNSLDRFLVRHPLSSNAGACACPCCKRMADSRTFQLAAMTCLYMSIKLHVDNGSDFDMERRRNFLLQDDYVKLSRGMFSSADICQMEVTVLTTLGWRVNPPTSMTFVSYLLTLIQQPSSKAVVPDAISESRQSAQHYQHHLYPYATRRKQRLLSNTTLDLVLYVLRELSRYLTEIAVVLSAGGLNEVSQTGWAVRLGDTTGTEDSLRHDPPSFVAFCSILACMELLTLQALPVRTRTVFAQRVMTLCAASWNHYHGSSGPFLEDRIVALRQRLFHTLVPEMLLVLEEEDEYYGRAAGQHRGGAPEPSSSSSAACMHPIRMARECGILDLAHIQQMTSSKNAAAASQDIMVVDKHSRTSRKQQVSPPVSAPSKLQQYQQALYREDEVYNADDENEFVITWQDSPVSSILGA